MANKITIDKSGNSESTNVLHMDDPQVQIDSAKRIVDFIEQEFRKVNPDAPIDMLVCGGCLRALMFGITREVLDRSGATMQEGLDHFAQQYDVAESQARDRLISDMFLSRFITEVKTKDTEHLLTGIATILGVVR